MRKWLGLLTTIGLMATLIACAFGLGLFYPNLDGRCMPVWEIARSRNAKWEVLPGVSLDGSREVIIGFATNLPKGWSAATADGQIGPTDKKRDLRVGRATIVPPGTIECQAQLGLLSITLPTSGAPSGASDQLYLNAFFPTSTYGNMRR